MCISGATVRVHMSPTMTDRERERARAWLRERRGAASQAALVDDIHEVTGWTITRDRYSKYESGGTDFGRGTLDQFVAYWEAKGEPGPDFSEPEAEPSLVTVLQALTDELRASRLARDETEIRYRMLDAEVRSLRERLNAAIPQGRSAPHETAGSGR